MSFNTLFTACLISCAAIGAAPTESHAQHISNTADTTVMIVGQVMDLTTKLPVANARIEIEGGSTVIRTNDEGKFFIRGSRLHTQSVAVRAIGYEPHAVEVETPTSGSVTADVWLLRASGGKVAQRSNEGQSRASHQRVRAIEMRTSSIR